MITYMKEENQELLCLILVLPLLPGPGALLLTLGTCGLAYPLLSIFPKSWCIVSWMYLPIFLIIQACISIFRPEFFEYKPKKESQS